LGMVPPEEFFGMTCQRKRELGWREGWKRDSSAAQADSFADERGEKASACSGRNDRGSF